MPRYFDYVGLKNVVCQNCIPPIQMELEAYKSTHLFLPEQCVFNPIEKTATIVVSDDNELSDEALDAEIRHVLADWIPPKEEVKKNPHHLLQASVGILMGGAMMMLMFMESYHLFILEIWMHNALLYSGMGLSIVIGYPSFKKAWMALRGKQKKINMDSLFALSTLAALVSTVLHFYFSVMPGMIDAALMINGFRHFGLWIEDKFTQKISSREKFVDRGRTSKFKIKQNGVFIDYEGELKDVPMNAILWVQKGQCIPLNGKLQEDGALSFALHTGKEDIQALKSGAQLQAGMIVASEGIILQVNALENESYLRKRDLSLIAAQSKKAPIQDMTSKILNGFMPAVLFLGVVLGLASGYVNGLAFGFQTMLYFMVCACPCALGMVTALAINIGLKKLSSDGVTFKTAKGMEAAAKVDTVVFDLNGTLTRNQPKVTQCTIDKKFFSVILAMESASQHSFGKVITDFIKNASSKTSHVTLDASLPGVHHGITRTFNGHVYKIGNKDFVNPPLNKQVSDFGNAQHAIYFSKDGVVQGYFLIDDPLRDGVQTASMIQALKQNKMDVKVFTGADQSTAYQYATQLGLPLHCFVTDCVPTKEQGDRNKWALINALQEEGHTVAMFGDAGNDVEAIKKADFGVVVNSKSTDPMAEQEADASITSDTLLPQVLKLFAVGRQTMHHIHQNLSISFMYNALSLVYVACAVFLKPELLNPAFGAGFMVFQSLFIVINAMRIHYQPARLEVEYLMPTVREVPVSPPVQSPSPTHTVNHVNPGLNLTSLQTMIPSPKLKQSY